MHFAPKYPNTVVMHEGGGLPKNLWNARLIVIVMIYQLSFRQASWKNKNDGTTKKWKFSHSTGDGQTDRQTEKSIIITSHSI